MLEKISRKITKRSIQISLGVLWLIDGLLQLQPKMFTTDFAHKVINPAASGQPIFVAGPMHLAMTLLLHQPFLFNLCFATTQLVIGFLILKKKTIRYGLIGSIIWGLSVWYLGEGLGGLAGGHATLFMGAPGAALIYAIISMAVLPSRNNDNQGRPANWLAYVWMTIWLGSVPLILWSQTTYRGLSSMLLSMTKGAPGWLAHLDKSSGTYVASTGNWFILFIIILSLVAGFMVILPGYYFRLAAVCVGIILSLAYWIVGQNLGTFYSGIATDPNTGPLLILLGIAILGSPNIKINAFSKSLVFLD